MAENMMQITGILDDYEHVADSLLNLLLEERSGLRQGRHEADEHLLQGKRQLIDQLAGAVDTIREYQRFANEDVFHLRANIERVQQKLLKILQLERELEKLMLTLQAPITRPAAIPPARFVGGAYLRAYS